MPLAAIGLLADARSSEPRDAVEQRVARLSCWVSPSARCRGTAGGASAACTSSSARGSRHTLLHE
eukprot:5485664-Prymnesium_polylepis.1